MSDYYITPEQWERAYKNGLTYLLVMTRVYRYGWKPEKAVTEPKRKKIGATIEQKKEANALGIKRSTIYKRIKAGWTVEEAHTTPTQTKKQALEAAHRKIKRIFTDEQLATAKRNGIHRNTADSRIKRQGWSMEDAITTPVIPPKERGRRGKKQTIKNHGQAMFMSKPEAHYIRNGVKHG